jgi:hypothetical protein
MAPESKPRRRRPVTMRDPVEVTRERFATHVAAQADWRRLKAEEYPEDERNARCAAGLGNVASCGGSQS